jgi:hypothetical protein
MLIIRLTRIEVSSLILPIALRTISNNRNNIEEEGCRRDQHLIQNGENIKCAHRRIKALVHTVIQLASS